jgi:hypothetical protein
MALRGCVSLGRYPGFPDAEVEDVAAIVVLVAVELDAVDRDSHALRGLQRLLRLEREVEPRELDRDRKRLMLPGCQVKRDGLFNRLDELWHGVAGYKAPWQPMDFSPVGAVFKVHFDV